MEGEGEVKCKILKPKSKGKGPRRAIARFDLSSIGKGAVVSDSPSHGPMMDKER